MTFFMKPLVPARRVPGEPGPSTWRLVVSNQSQGPWARAKVRPGRWELSGRGTRSHSGILPVFPSPGTHASPSSNSLRAPRTNRSTGVVGWDNKLCRLRGDEWGARRRGLGASLASHSEVRRSAAAKEFPRIRTIRAHLYSFRSWMMVARWDGLDSRTGLNRRGT